MSTFYDLNDVYYNLRKRFDFLLISDEIGKSKPATLFFLSKFIFKYINGNKFREIKKEFSNDKRYKM